MYLEHFGLSQRPFNITPDPDMFYAGANRGAVREALSYIVLGGEGITKVVGEVGSGKTMLARMLADALPEQVDIIYLTNPKLSPSEILSVIAAELGLPDKAMDPNKCMYTLQHELIKRHAANRQVVLFIDEAQAMPLETLEQIRLLSNLETAEHKLLQIVLFGQPELDKELNDPTIRQIRERITNNLTLDPFTAKDIEAYLDFRLRQADYKGPPLFSAPICKAIHKHSQGLTRRINILADKTLMAAFTNGEHQVTRQHLATAVRDSGYTPIGRKMFSLPFPPRWALAASAAVLGIGLAIATPALLQSQDSEPNVSVSLDTPAEPEATVVTHAQPQPMQPKNVSAATDIEFLPGRLKATETGLIESSGKGYTIQLMTSPKRLGDSLEEMLVKEQPTLQAASIYIYPFAARNREYLSVVYGSYATKQEALAGLKTLPARFQSHKPYIRSLASVRKESATVLAEKAAMSGDLALR